MLSGKYFLKNNHGCHLFRYFCVSVPSTSSTSMHFFPLFFLHFGSAGFRGFFSTGGSTEIVQKNREGGIMQLTHILSQIMMIRYDTSVGVWLAIRNDEIVWQGLMVYKGVSTGLHYIFLQLRHQLQTIKPVARVLRDKYS